MIPNVQVVVRRRVVERRVPVYRLSNNYSVLLAVGGRRWCLIFAGGEIMVHCKFDLIIIAIDYLY